MIPVDIKTLVVIQPPNPSFVILQPHEDARENPRVGGKVIPIWIGYSEAVHLGVALESKRLERPTTHDLLLDLMTNLDGCIDHVDISAVKGTLFFSTLYVRQYGRLITADARPSDTLALAVRQGAPIYVAEEIFDTVGCTFSFTAKRGTKAEAAEIEEFKKFLADLTPDDFGSSEGTD